MRPFTFHLSFDFWNTIAKPNPVYAGERTRFLADMFCVDEATAKATYSSVKGHLDHLAETKGTQTGYYDTIATLCEAFGMKPARPDTQPAFRWNEKQNIFMRRLGNGMDDLFERYPPTVDPALVEQLQRANKMWSLLPGEMITLSIGSNTNFIRGHLINDHVLRRLPFAFSLFSDETDCAKPSPEFFQLVVGKAWRANARISRNSEIVHIGDNPVCDGQGAIAAGLRYASVTNADHTAEVVSTILDAIK